MNFSNSTTDKTERLKDTKSLEFQWETIDWKQVEFDVNRLQTRIAKATKKKGTIIKPKDYNTY
ncbi:reverse transcriptase N-terminal domain-containing protein [Clostridium sp. BJN0013]|uniref:reverse transcriptase N-terminal domain-containing protein n=1 Tax=Clostridium sp. BJN0013 TaxID=3236840 RepID=UPI0034C6DB70